jgi:carbon monoxide dehydrogenase subunit G
MEFDNTFEVQSPVDEVWKAVLDVERVAPCVPGAQVLEKTGEDSYKVAIKVKLGPVSMTYRGDVEVVEADEAAHVAKMRARARETRGQGTADATVEMRLTDEGAKTKGDIHTDVAISGRAAAMGQRMIGDVSAKLIDTFAANLAAMLGEAPAPAPAPAAPAPAAAAAAAEGATPPPPPPPPPASDEGLPVLDLVGGVVGDRLKDPRALVGALLTALLLGFLLGRRG